MLEPDDLPVRSITRASSVSTVSEWANSETTASTAVPIDPVQLLSRIEALEALLAASNAKINSLQNENLRLQSQITANTAINDDDDSSGSTTTRIPPRKVAKKAANGNARPAAAGNIMEDDDEFPVFPSTSRAMPSSSAHTNRFAPLASTSTNNISNANKNKANKTAPRDAAANNQNQQRKKVIQAIDTSLFAVRRQLAAANISSFSVKQTRKSGPIKIVISDEAEVGPAMSALVDAKTSFHEFKWADEKQKCFIIRGLVGATAEDLPYIKQELCDAGLPDSIMVSLHQTGYMRANQSASNDAPVKLLLPAGVDTSTLQGIRFLDHIAVRFDLFRSKSIVQCKNCQRFGHSAGGCQHPHRCVKCGENHFREDCPRTHDTSVKLKCCNCGGEHTANNVNNCEFFQRHYAKASNAAASAPAATSAGTARKPLPPAPRLPGISFAQMLARNSGRSTTAASRVAPTSNAPVSSLNTNSADLVSFDRRLCTLENHLSSIATAIKDISNKQDNSLQLFAKHDKIINLLIANLNYD